MHHILHGHTGFICSTKLCKIILHSLLHTELKLQSDHKLMKGCAKRQLLGVFLLPSTNFNQNRVGSYTKLAPT